MLGLKNEELANSSPFNSYYLTYETQSIAKRNSYHAV